MRRSFAVWLADRPSRRSRSRTRPVVEALDTKQLLSSLPSAIAAGPSPPAVASIAARPFVQRLANLPFSSRDGRRLALDVYLPPGETTQPRPVMIAIHGGGWRRFNKEEFGPRAAVFARQGFVVVVPNYTLSRASAASWPANFEDVRAAVAWTRSNAARFGIDPNRLAAVGESAGGHLAELLGTHGDYPDGLGARARVNAVVALAGPSDLNTLSATSRQGAGLAVAQMLGSRRGGASNLGRLASPITYVSATSAPMLLIHGQSDLLVPPDQSITMALALQRVGVRSQVVMVNAGHVLDFKVGGRDLVPVVTDFLARSWK